jgi:hypothetical protein
MIDPLEAMAVEMEAGEASMYMRVTRGGLDPARAAVYRRAADERLLPTLRELPGFWGVYGGVDAATGALCLMTLWETREQAAAPNVLRPLLEALGVGLGTPEVYEVHVHA